MPNIFQVQGFGALSEWNGQFSSASAGQAFQTIASLGSNSIELSPRIWTQSATSTSVFADPQKTESDASLAAGIRAAEAAGLSVILKPTISALSGAGSSSLAPSDVGAFFASYTAEIVHLATIAQDNGVSTFALGNEMSGLTGAQYRGYWVDMIAEVHQVFHGELTYAAATDEASKVSFWDQLDTIGVNTYPPLTSSQTPTVQDLVHAWTEVPFNPYYAAAFEYKSPVDFLHSLSEQYGKPVLMTEVGYRSIDGTAINPGSWTSSGTANANAQADAYNAFFQVWATHGGSWFKGAEFWQWDLNNQYSDTGYSPMGKPAENVVSQYFHGEGTIPNITVTGSAIADVIDIGWGNNVIHSGLGDDVIRVGDGNNVIYAGPDTISKLAATTITLTGYGSVVDGTGAQVQVLVNGTAVSGLLEFKSATDPSGYQTYTVTFDNPAEITSLDVELTNSVSGRAFHLKDMLVNGVALSPSEGVNTSSPGTFDLYVRSIHFDTTSHQDWFFGASTDNDVIYTGSGNNTVYAGAGNDVIYGGSGNDTIVGGSGNDYFYGGSGTNTAVFKGDVADYDISHVGNQIIVADRVADRDGTDHLVNVTYLKFADTTIDTADLATTQSAALARVSSLSPAVGVAGSSVISDTIHHADGWQDVYDYYNTAGANEVVRHETVDPAGHSTLIEQFHADGTLALKQTMSVDDVRTLDLYDEAGRLSQQTVTQKDGSYVQYDYAADGALTAATDRHADGAREVDLFGITGQAYAARHDVLDAAGHRLATTFDNTDGSQTMTAYASDVTLAVTAANTVMNSAGGDTFVFKQPSGHDTINHFRAGDAAGHDVVEIAASMAADLAVHAAGHDTVIDFGHGALTLTDVVTPLTAHDVLIV